MTATAPNLGKTFNGTARPATDEDIAILVPGDWIKRQEHPWCYNFKKWDGDRAICTWEGDEFFVPRHLLMVVEVLEGRACEKFFRSLEKRNLKEAEISTDYSQLKVGDKFSLNPGVTQEFEVKAIIKGKKPYQIKWEHGPNETHQVDLEFFRRFKRVVEDDRWNPSNFGEVPHQVDADGQVTIFFDDADEPPEPDDFHTIEEFNRAWDEWEQRGAEPEKTLTDENDERKVVTQFNKGDKVAPAWPAGRGRRGVVEKAEKNFAYIDWANGTSGKVRFDQLLLVERAKEESLPTPFWRSKFGLHPCDQVPEGAQKDHIRCDTLPVDQQIRISQERIFQQNWRIQDLESQPKQSKDIKKTIESAKSNIAFEEELIDLLLPNLNAYCEFIDSGVSEDEAKKMSLGIIAKVQLPEILISSPALKNEVPEKLKFAYQQLRQRGISHQEALEVLGPG